MNSYKALNVVDKFSTNLTQTNYFSNSLVDAVFVKRVASLVGLFVAVIRVSRRGNADCRYRYYSNFLQLVTVFWSFSRKTPVGWFILKQSISNHHSVAQYMSSNSGAKLKSNLSFDLPSVTIEKRAKKFTDGVYDIICV